MFFKPHNPDTHTHRNQKKNQTDSFDFFVCLMSSEERNISRISIKKRRNTLYPTIFFSTDIDMHKKKKFPRNFPLLPLSPMDKKNIL